MRARRFLHDGQPLGARSSGGSFPGEVACPMQVIIKTTFRSTFIVGGNSLMRFRRSLLASPGNPAAPARGDLRWSIRCGRWRACGTRPPAPAATRRPPAGTPGECPRPGWSASHRSPGRGSGSGRRRRQVARSQGSMMWPDDLLRSRCCSARWSRPPTIVERSPNRSLKTTTIPRRLANSAAWCRAIVISGRADLGGGDRRKDLVELTGLGARRQVGRHRVGVHGQSHRVALLQCHVQPSAPPAARPHGAACSGQ